MLPLHPTPKAAGEWDDEVIRAHYWLMPSSSLILARGGGGSHWKHLFGLCGPSPPMMGTLLQVPCFFLMPLRDSACDTFVLHRTSILPSSDPKVFSASLHSNGTSPYNTYGDGQRANAWMGPLTSSLQIFISPADGSFSPVPSGWTLLSL